MKQSLRLILNFQSNYTRKYLIIECKHCSNKPNQLLTNNKLIMYILNFEVFRTNAKIYICLCETDRQTEAQTFKYPIESFIDFIVFDVCNTTTSTSIPDTKQYIDMCQAFGWIWMSLPLFCVCVCGFLVMFVSVLDFIC